MKNTTKEVDKPFDDLVELQYQDSLFLQMYKKQQKDKEIQQLLEVKWSTMVVIILMILVVMIMSSIVLIYKGIKRQYHINQLYYA